MMHQSIGTPGLCEKRIMASVFTLSLLAVQGCGQVTIPIDLTVPPSVDLTEPSPAARSCPSLTMPLETGSTARCSEPRDPAEGGCTTSPFGAPRSDGPHQGTDFRAAIGTPVYAAADGEVIRTATTTNGGMEIFIRHFGQDGTVFFTSYAHLSQFLVSGTPPFNVRRDQLIGRSGDTGVPGQPHLHFEFRQGTPIITSPPGGLFNDAAAIDPSSCFDSCVGGRVFREGECTDAIDDGLGILFPF